MGEKGTQKPTEAAEQEHTDEIVSHSRLYENALAKYRLNIEQGVEAAAERYGFTLFHSLSPMEKISLKDRLGFKPYDEIDFYNLGCLEAQQGNFEKAIGYFSRAVEQQADFANAVYNLALAYERAGKIDKAKRMWKRYLELVPAGDEHRAVSEHLRQI